jgi:hypothetical protein
MVRMVPLVTASSPFEARVIAARLGADGILWELRGALGGQFGVGPVDVLVEADEYDLARQLLTPAYDDGAGG